MTFFRIDGPTALHPPRTQIRRDSRSSANRPGKAPRPDIDVFESDDKLIFRGDLPGFAREDISVVLDRGRLILSGTRKNENERGWKLLRSERPEGEFRRSFILPDSASADSIEASLRNGVLTVEIAKKETAKKREIPVQVN